jgi:Tfp pilus assembly protein FimT
MPLTKIAIVLAAVAVCLAFAAPGLASGGRSAQATASGRHLIDSAVCVVKVHGHIRRCPHFRG